MDRRKTLPFLVLGVSLSLTAAGCFLFPSKRIPPEPPYGAGERPAPAPEVGFGSSPHASIAPPSGLAGAPVNPYALNGSAGSDASGAALEVPTIGSPAVDPGGANGGTNVP